MHEMETHLIENENGELVIKEDSLKRLKELKEQKDGIERELKTLSTAITNEIKTHYTETTKISGYNFVVKGGFYDVVFDVDSFMSENLALYLKYLKPHQSTISYSLVSATRGKE